MPRVVVRLDDLEGIHVNYEFHFTFHHIADLRIKALRHEEDIAFRMVDYVVDLIFRTVRKNRDGNAAECNCTAESHRPVWHALGENRHFVTFTYPYWVRSLDSLSHSSLKFP